MAKCTGVRCPMQHGHKADECNHTDCPYRTEPMTNADRIRAMSDEELADMMTVMNGCFTCHECFENNGGRCNADCVKNCFNWLKQPAE